MNNMNVGGSLNNRDDISNIHETVIKLRNNANDAKKDALADRTLDAFTKLKSVFVKFNELDLDKKKIMKWSLEDKELISNSVNELRENFLTAKTLISKDLDVSQQAVSKTWEKKIKKICDNVIGRTLKLYQPGEEFSLPPAPQNDNANVRERNRPVPPPKPSPSKVGTNVSPKPVPRPLPPVPQNNNANVRKRNLPIPPPKPE